MGSEMCIRDSNKCDDARRAGMRTLSTSSAQSERGGNIHACINTCIKASIFTRFVLVFIHANPFGRDACGRLTRKQYSRKSLFATRRRVMTRGEQAWEHGRACVYVHAVYVRHFFVVFIVGNTTPGRVNLRHSASFPLCIVVAFLSVPTNGSTSCIAYRSDAN